MLDPLRYLIIGTGPLLGEVTLGDIIDNVLDGALDQLRWRHIQCLEDVELYELLVSGGDRTLEVVLVLLKVVRDVLLAAIF